MSKYIWQEKYEAALVETDPFKLPKRIASAKDAINKRLRILKPHHSSSAKVEYQAILDAEVMLRGLENFHRDSG
jgi:hypothetical protein